MVRCLGNAVGNIQKEDPERQKNDYAYLDLLARGTVEYGEQ